MSKNLKGTLEAWASRYFSYWDSRCGINVTYENMHQAFDGCVCPPHEIHYPSIREAILSEAGKEITGIGVLA